MKKYILTAIILIFIFPKINAQIFTIKKEYKKALSINTIESYATFSDNFTKAKNRKYAIKYFKVVRFKLDSLYAVKDWNHALYVDSLCIYNTFLQNHKKTQFTNSCIIKIDSINTLNAWNDALIINNLQSYSDFLDKYNKSKYNKACLIKIDSVKSMIAWDEIKNTTDTLKIQNFIIEHNKNSTVKHLARDRIKYIKQAKIEFYEIEKKLLKFKPYFFRTKYSSKEWSREIVKGLPEYFESQLNFLNNYEAHSFVYEKQKLRKLKKAKRFLWAKYGITIYEKFIENYPNNSLRDSALIKINNLKKIIDTNKLKNENLIQKNKKNENMIVITNSTNSIIAVNLKDYSGENWKRDDKKVENFKNRFFNNNSDNNSNELIDFIIKNDVGLIALGDTKTMYIKNGFYIMKIYSFNWRTNLYESLEYFEGGFYGYEFTIK